MRRTHLLLALAGAVVITVLAWGVDREGGPGAQGKTCADAPQPVALAGAQRPAVVPQDVPATSRSERRQGLESRLVSRRVAALECIVQEGGAGAALHTRVASLVQDADPRVALWARGALLRLDGTRGLRAEVSRAALENPGWEDAERVLRSVSPETADALLAAAAEQRARADKGVVLVGLDAAVGEWAGSGASDAADLSRPLAWASGEDLLAWLRIVRGLRPVPVAALRALAGRVRTALPHDAGAIAKFFSAGPDLSRADDGVERALLEQAVASTPGRAGAWLLALARLPRLSDTARRGLDELRSRSPEDAQDVETALRARG